MQTGIFREEIALGRNSNCTCNHARVLVTYICVTCTEFCKATFLCLSNIQYMVIYRQAQVYKYMHLCLFKIAYKCQ